MTTAEMEQYVRSKWQPSCINSFSRMQPKLYFDDKFLWFDSWKEFYDFTIAREVEVRQVEEEIKFLHELKSFGSWVENHTGWQRILAREQAALADLKRGLKV